LGGGVQDYRLYFLGRDGNITRGEAFRAPTENVALMRAAETKSPHGVELWQGDRKIRTFPAFVD
jgi:hypothetical protein